MLERATSLLTMNGFKLKLSYAHQSSFSPVYVASPYASSWFTDPASGTTVYFMYWDPTAYTSKYPYTNAASGVGTFVAPAVSSSYKDGGNGETSKNMDDELNAFLADVAQEINSETAGAATSTSVAASATATAVVAEKKGELFFNNSRMGLFLDLISSHLYLLPRHNF